MLGMTSIWHWMIVLLVILLVFGAGKLPKVMGDAAKGIKAFRSNMKDDESETAAKPVEAAASPDQARG